MPMVRVKWTSFMATFLILRLCWGPAFLRRTCSKSIMRQGDCNGDNRVGFFRAFGCARAYGCRQCGSTPPWCQGQEGEVESVRLSPPPGSRCGPYHPQG